MCCCCLSLFGSCRSSVALMCVGDLSTTGQSAQERTGLQPGPSVSTLIWLLGMTEISFELLDPEPENIHTTELGFRHLPHLHPLPCGW